MPFLLPIPQIVVQASPQLLLYTPPQNTPFLDIVIRNVIMMHGGGNTMIILFLFLCIVVYKAQVVSDGYANCLSVEATRSIRGICALIIVLHHLAQEIDTFSPFCIVFKPLGFLAVTVFFFYSGYGLMKSHQCKADYKKHSLSSGYARFWSPTYA